MEPILDQKVLKALLAEIDASTVTMLLQSFIDEVEIRMVNMEKIVQSGVLDQLEHEAHAIKSVSGTFGALKLNELSRYIELNCKSIDSEKLSNLHPELVETSQKTIETFKEYMSNLPG